MISAGNWHKAANQSLDISTYRQYYHNKRPAASGGGMEVPMTKRPSTFAALLAFLFAFLCLALSSLLTSLLVREGVSLGFFAYLHITVVQGVAFAVPVLLYYRCHAQIRPALRFRRMDPLCGALIVLAALLGVLPLNWVSLYWTLALKALGLTTSTGADIIPATARELWLSLAVLAVLPALFEEMLFRGLLLPSLEKLGLWRAALVSGMLFALPHARLEALPAHLLLGVLLAWLTLLTGTLFSAMLFHGVYNAAILLLGYFAASPMEKSALPTLAEAVEILPTMVLLLGVFLLISYAAMARGRNRAAGPLRAAPRLPLRVGERALLALSAMLLAGLEILTLFGMLQGV